MKAAIAVDDWKLPVFRKRLTDAGFKYEDAGEFTPGTTILHVHYESINPLYQVIAASERECKEQRRG